MSPRDFQSLVQFLWLQVVVATAAIAAPQTTSANVPVEIAFSAQRAHADPFNEINLDVRFVAPDGSELKVPAFWAGGANWKVRYASGSTGTHRWRSE